VVVGLLLEGSHLLVALQQVQLPAQGMVKDGAVAPKEVMEVDPMLAMITEDKHLFHLGLLHTDPPLGRPHISTTAPPEDARSYRRTIE